MNAQGKRTKGKAKKPSRNSTINNWNISHAKSIGRRYFGDNMRACQHAGSVFNIFIYDSVDRKKIDEFQERWPEFNIIIETSIPYKNI